MQDWQHLGLEGPSTDLATIKRAYAKRLRTTRPDDDAEAYQALREAYDRMVQRARQRVTIQHAGPGGTLTVHYADLDQLDRVCRLLAQR